MKSYLVALRAAGIGVLLLATFSSLAQQPGGQPPGQPPVETPGGGQGQGGGGGRGGRGGFGGRFGGPVLPDDQQAEVDRITTALEVENAAVTLASSNLVVATFSVPVDKSKIAQANDELAKAREVWLTKASKLFAETQASDKKLSSEAIAVLAQRASGRGGRGRFGPPGFGRGGPGGQGAGSGRRGAGPNRGDQPGQ